MENVRVTRLEAENYRGLKAIDVTHKVPGLLLLRGPNAAGKTSAIDAMHAALGGASAAPELPIHADAQSGYVKVALGDGIRHIADAEVHWSRDKHGEPKRKAIVVVDHRGDEPVRVTKPQSWLNEMVVGSGVAFDPLVFARETDAAKQLAMLVDAAGIRGEWERLGVKIERAVSSRRDANRNVTDIEARLRTMSDPSPEEELEVVDTASLMQQLQRATASNDEHGTVVRSVQEAKERIARLQEQLEAEQHRVKVAEAWIRDNPLVDVSDLKAQLSNASGISDDARRQREFRETRDSLYAAKTRSDEADAQVDECRRQRVELVRSAFVDRLPKLSVDADGTLRYDGRPIDQCSGMERLFISVTIAHLGSKLATICIDEGDGLDDENLARLAQYAEDNDLAIWMTVTRATGPDGTATINMKDGMAYDTREPAVIERKTPR